MDSGSGSLQSSSGGDDEYDSHQPQFIPPPPSFSFHNIVPPSVGSSIIPPPQIPFNNYQNLPAPTFYDFSSNYNLQQQPHFNPDANSFLNLEPTPTDFKNPSPSSAAAAGGGGSTPQGSTQNQGPFRGGASSSGLHPKASTKKRTRASRRAPTTVLTTDTSNFRAMVQEFTGIPSPPFSAGGSAYSRRFDLFSSASSAIRTAAGANLEPPGSAFYPSRSKIQQPSPLLNTNNNATAERETTMSNIQQQTPGGIFSFQITGAEGRNNNVEAGHSNIHVLSVLQNDTGNCKLNFSGGSSSNKETMGNIVSSTRGESTVDSWICPTD